ncbi:hypothetical protein MMC07_006194 [Pseudocyphellaria aurata]|nr:hypothetical protein [Pseudocyphellaria aurata]
MAWGNHSRCSNVFHHDDDWSNCRYDTDVRSAGAENFAVPMGGKLSLLRNYLEHSKPHRSIRCVRYTPIPSLPWGVDIVVHTASAPPSKTSSTIRVSSVAQRPLYWRSRPLRTVGSLTMGRSTNHTGHRLQESSFR